MSDFNSLMNGYSSSNYDMDLTHLGIKREQKEDNELANDNYQKEDDNNESVQVQELEDEHTEQVEPELAYEQQAQDDNHETISKEDIEEKTKQVIEEHVELKNNQNDNKTEQFEYDKSIAFCVDGDTKQLKYLPNALIECLRQQLEAYSEDFSKEISMSALVTAFLIAKTGVDIKVDKNTAQAIKGFKLLKPELSSLEGIVRALNENVAKACKQITLMNKDVKQQNENSLAVLLGQSFLMADYVSNITSGFSSVKDLPLDNPNVEVVRRNMKAQAQKIITADKISNGRPLR